MRSCLALAIFLIACDPKGNAGSATASGTGTSGNATSSDSTSGATSGVAPTGTVSTSTGDSSTTATSTATAASTSEGGPHLCMCDDPDCTSPALCDTIEAHCDTLCAFAGWAGVDNEAALQCALQALRDRTPGVVGWTASTISDGPDNEQVTLRILADGTVLRDPQFTTIFCTTYGPDTHNTLKSPDYFTGCLAMPDPGDRFLCMVAATEVELAECTPIQNC